MQIMEVIPWYQPLRPNLHTHQMVREIPHTRGQLSHWANLDTGDTRAEASLFGQLIKQLLRSMCILASAGIRGAVFPEEYFTPHEY